MAVFDVPLIVYVQGGELAEPLMQASQVPSPSEEAGYASPDARQDSRTYIPPGFTVERSGNAMFLLVKQSMPKQHLLECCTGMLHRNAAQRPVLFRRIVALQITYVCNCDENQLRFKIWC